MSETLPKREPSSLYGMISLARNDWLWRYHDEKRLLIRYLRTQNVDFFSLQQRERKNKKTPLETFDLLAYIMNAYMTRRQRKIVDVAVSPEFYLILIIKYIQVILITLKEVRNQK